MSYISQNGLNNLKDYKYVSGGYTPLDCLMTPFWDAVVNIVPLWMAPNLITFIGFVIMIIGNVLFLCYDLTFTETIPSWVFLYNAMAIFIY